MQLTGIYTAEIGMLFLFNPVPSPPSPIQGTLHLQSPGKGRVCLFLERLKTLESTFTAFLEAKPNKLSQSDAPA